MNHRSLPAAFLCLSIALSRRRQAQPPAGPPAPLPTRDAPLMLNAGAQKVRVVLVADGLVGPWDIVFLPDGNLLVTESNGALRIDREGVSSSPSPCGSAFAPGNDVLHGFVHSPGLRAQPSRLCSYLKDGGDKGQTLGDFARRGSTARS